MWPFALPPRPARPLPLARRTHSPLARGPHSPLARGPHSPLAGGLLAGGLLACTPRPEVQLSRNGWNPAASAAASGGPGRAGPSSGGEGLATAGSAEGGLRAAPVGSAAGVASAAGSAASAGAAAVPEGDRVEALLYPVTDDVAHAACAGAGEGRARCLFERRFTGELRAEALALYAAGGTVIGLEPAAELDGGYRGMIQIVPEEPVGKYRHHLGWATGALREFSEFFAWLGPGLNYRWRPGGLLFFRSVGRHTPAAYAGNWRVAYNVEGGINTSADEVRETFFHEIFHLNDEGHGGWSDTALEPIRTRILARCGARTACLRPYAPGKTMVRGGTYYAFQPGNGVGEYAAELALRYHVEHRLVWRGKPVPHPFKCGPAENQEAWSLLVREFFGGVDRTPACPATSP